MSRKRLRIKNEGLRIARARRVYLDYAATTPIAPEVLKVMQKTEREVWGNASSIHAEGVAAKKVLDEARRQTALALSTHPDEIVFTSGGTESNNLAIFGVAADPIIISLTNIISQTNKKQNVHIVTSTIEHSSVLQPIRELERQGCSVSYVSPRENGIISADDVLKAIRPDTVLVSIQYVNNEIGTVQPILKIGKFVKDQRSKIKDSKLIFHVDASQAPLYCDCSPNRLGADLVTLDGHKMYGPKGIGMLYVRRGTAIAPILFGGGQEGGIRSTTESVPAIAGFATALELANKNRQKESERLTLIRDYAFAKIKKELPRAIINGDERDRSPNNINISLPLSNPEFAVLKLDVAGISCSTKSSCIAGEGESYVVKELGGEAWRPKGTLRFTMGSATTKKDIDYLVKELRNILA